MAAVLYLVELVATGDPIGTLPFAAAIGAVFWLTALSERRRRRKRNLPLR
ncbi:hypothetical protein OIB37_21295 [Streptomyces sp. NBC_00820]|nr:hypothetical protein OIB37_21295 [Streptomyces sp. NBC_00820]